VILSIFFTFKEQKKLDLLIFDGKSSSFDGTINSTVLIFFKIVVSDFFGGSKHGILGFLRLLRPDFASNLYIFPLRVKFGQLRAERFFPLKAKRSNFILF